MMTSQAYSRTPTSLCSLAVKLGIDDVMMTSRSKFQKPTSRCSMDSNAMAQKLTTCDVMMTKFRKPTFSWSLTLQYYVEVKIFARNPMTSPKRVFVMS